MGQRWVRLAYFYGDGYARTSGGKFLVAHAQSLSAGTLAVDVNEQNEAALRFYMMLGFSVETRYHWMQAVSHSLFCT